MSKHVIEWLNAYLDGELRGSQVQQVESHLVECETCREELESLARISSLLHEVPAPEFTPPERFAAQVNLRLPRRQMPASSSTFLEIGWWMIPVGLLGAWIFVSTSAVVSRMLSAANSMGLMSGLSGWLTFGSADQYAWSTTLGQVGVLSGNSLDWAVMTEALTRTSLPQFTVYVSIALLYLGWMAIWWARRQRQEQV